jgi:hypothetical protein
MEKQVPAPGPAWPWSEPSTAGQTSSQVQTAADSSRYYGLPEGAPGKLGLCRGGTGEREDCLPGDWQ